jgi:pantoate--beta-alanine ligase
MGALHHGHLALMKEARRLVGSDGTLAVSIFVNPIQFERPGDLQAYPRTLESDLSACADTGVDVVFTPPKEALYHPDHSVMVTENRLTRHLCGASRPGHFEGVLTIVLKLFHLFQPQFAVFGDKDFQQLALIRRMVRDLNHPVSIIGHPTVRDSDGLALSSRNKRLTTSQRTDASRIPRSLRAAKDLEVTGEQNPAIYLDCARSHLLAEAPPEFSLDYLELVDPESLTPLRKIVGKGLLAAACYYDDVRLIDHLLIEVA